MQTDKRMMSNQSDIVVPDKVEKIDETVPNDSNITKKECEKLEKSQGLREPLERMLGVKATVASVVIGALEAGTHQGWRRGSRRSPSGMSVQESAVLGTAKIVSRILKLPGG